MVGMNENVSFPYVEKEERRGLSTHRPPSMSIEKAVLNKVKAKNPSTFPTDGQNGRRA